MSPSSPADVKDIPKAADREISAAPAKAWAKRSDWLSAVGQLTEEEYELDGIGLLLLSEVTGEVRASIMTDQSAVLLSEEKVKKINRLEYERTLLLGGVVDPLSPVGARLPFFGPADATSFMKVGGSKVGAVVDVIERLSLLGQYAQRAEGNSNGTLNGAGTSK